MCVWFCMDFLNIYLCVKLIVYKYDVLMCEICYLLCLNVWIIVFNDFYRYMDIFI